MVWFVLIACIDFIRRSYQFLRKPKVAYAESLVDLVRAITWGTLDRNYGVRSSGIGTWGSVTPSKMVDSMTPS